MSNVLNLEQEENTHSGILVNPLDNLTCSNLRQLEKAHLPISITVSGISILRIALQEKAQSSIILSSLKMLYCQYD